MDKGIYLAILTGLGLAVGLTSRDFESSKVRVPARNSVPDGIEIRVAAANTRNQTTVIEDSGKAYIISYDSQGKLKIAPAYNVRTVED